MSFDKTIQMYIFDGDPNGRIMCELSNWNGRLYKIARTQLSDFSERADANHTGVYFLFGKDDDNNDTVYIGEAEYMLQRLKQHINEKEYWNDCIVVISKDNLLNKAHIKYLENVFYNFAKSSGRFTVINANTPTKSSVSEYDEAMLEEFISNTKLLVNALGYKVFDTVTKKTPKKEQEQIEFYLKSGKGADAQGLMVADGFAVLKGSKLSIQVSKAFPAHWMKKRQMLLNKQIINSEYIFESDYIFTSPSAAAAVILGRSANGLTEWKTHNGKTIKAIEEEKLK